MITIYREEMKLMEHGKLSENIPYQTDVCIIGLGPAGLGASLTLLKADLESMLGILLKIERAIYWMEANVIKNIHALWYLA